MKSRNLGQSSTWVCPVP